MENGAGNREGMNSHTGPAGADAADLDQHRAAAGARTTGGSAPLAGGSKRQRVEITAAVGEKPGLISPACQTNGVESKGAPKRTRAKLSSRLVMAGTGQVRAHEMLDATPLWASGDWDRLRERLQLDGYLLLRGVLPEADVLEARQFLLEELRAWRPDSFQADDGGPEAKLVAGAAGLGLLGRQDLAAAPQVAAVLESPSLFHLMEKLLQEDAVITTGYKWLRAVARAEFTGLHTDRVFLGRGSPRLLTAWLPLGAVPAARGSLLVARGSHRLRAFERLRNGYGTSEVGDDGTRSGWLADDGRFLNGPAAATTVDWRIADVAPGDIIVLGLDVLHMSAANCTDTVRLSCDTRWQPASAERDPRLVLWRESGGRQV